MNRLSIIILCAAGFLVQALLAPSSGAAILLVPLAILLYSGVDRQSVVSASLVSMVGELLTLLPLGSILLPTLIIAALLRFLQGVLDMKSLDNRQAWNMSNLVLLSGSGAVVVVLALVLHGILVQLLGEHTLPWASTVAFLKQGWLLVYNMGLLVVFILLLRLLRRTHIYE